MGFGAIGNKCLLLLPINGYSSVSVHMLLLSYLLHLMSFMASFGIDDWPLCLVLNSIYFIRFVDGQF